MPVRTLIEEALGEERSSKGAAFFSHRRIVAAALAATLVGAVVTLARETATGTPDRPCVLVLIADRSGSANRAAVTDARAEEAKQVLESRSSCDYAVISSIKQYAGQSDMAVIRLPGTTDSFAEEVEVLDGAKETVDDVFTANPESRTNFFVTQLEVYNQVTAISQQADVEAFYWFDGVHSVLPLNLYKIFVETPDADISELVSQARPTASCTGWRVHLLGVNRTRRDKLPSEVAAGVQQFWHAYFPSCGGTLETYAPTLPPQLVESG